MEILRSSWNGKEHIRGSWKKTKNFVAVENVVFLFFQFSTFPTWICFCMFGFDCWSCFNVKYLEAQNGFPTQSYRFIIVPFGIASRKEKARYRERQFDWHVCGMMESLELINRCKTIFYSQLYIMFRYCRLMGLHDMFLSQFKYIRSMLFQSHPNIRWNSDYSEN